MQPISKTIFWILPAFLSITSIHAQTARPNTGLMPGAMVLFKGVKTSLATTDKNIIYQGLGLKLSTNKKQFVDKDDKEEASPYMEVDVYPTDLNKDGVEEEFVVLNNPALYGQTGAAIVLFTKNTSNQYQKVQEIPAADLFPLPTANAGYPDLLLGVAGMLIPVWRWNGHKYNLYKSWKDGQAPSGGKGLADISKAYQVTVK